MPRRQTRTVSSLIKSLTIDVMQAVIIEMGNNPDAIIRKGRRAEYEVLIRRYHNANQDIDMHAFVDRVILAIDELQFKKISVLQEEFDEVFCAKEKAMAILVSILSDESPLDLTRLGDRFQRTNDHYSWDDSYKDLLGSFSDFLRNNDRFTVLDPEKQVFSVCLGAEYEQPHNSDNCLDMAGDDSDVDVVVVDDDDQEDDDAELVRARAREREYNHGGEVQKTKKDDTLSDSRSTKTTKRSSFFRKTERNNASAALGHHDAEVQKKEKDGDGGKDVMHDTSINSIATTTLVPLSSHSSSNVTSSVDPQTRSHGVEEEANAATTFPFAPQQNTTTTLEQSHQPPPVKKRKLNIDTDQACEALCELPY